MPYSFRSVLEGQITRVPDPAVSQRLAFASLKLEHLAACFIIDASHFFDICSEELAWEWPKLRSLTLTSQLLTPSNKLSHTIDLLRAAATVAMNMPQLETLEIWNGRRELAALFQYNRHARASKITWRATWEISLPAIVTQPWEEVMFRHGGWRLDVVHEPDLDRATIRSHADAIQHLKLKNQVIRPISLQQIRMEQKVLENVDLVS